jgi:putative ABC transport system substrate-binding protein
MRRLGVFMAVDESDPAAQRDLETFRKRLAQLGWTEGRNLQIEYRWALGDAALFRKFAAELVALSPDVILAQGSGSVGPLLQVTRTLPIVFTGVVDPVGAGLVASLSRPGGNATGFAIFEHSLAVKWLEILKEIAPRTKRVAVIRNPVQFTGIGQLAAIQAVAPSLRIEELIVIDVRSPDEMASALAEFSRKSEGGLIVTSSGAAVIHRQQIIALAANLKLPSVYPLRFFAADGGLVSYGPETIDQYVRAAGYVDRIFHGETPSDLPVQGPTKFEMIVNLKTAKALGLTIPETLLATADEVIQ